MKFGAHGPNRRRSCPRAQIMKKSIFSAESQFSWNWVLTAQIGAQAVPELRSRENQFLRPNRNFHEIGCSLPKSAQKLAELRSWENQFLRPNRNFHEIGCSLPKSAQKLARAQIMRKSIFTVELQFSWNWVLTAQIGAQAVPGHRSWENQFLRPNRNFHEIGCSRRKSTKKLSPSWDHEKINFYLQMAIFMKLGAHGRNRRRNCPRAQIMRKSIFTAESQFSWNWVRTAQIGAQAVPELRSWENQFLRPNRNFHEIGCSRPKSTQKPSPSSDHEKINFYGRIAIFMKLGAHGPNQRRTRPRAQIMRKSIFTAESQFSWNWVLTAQSNAEAVPELRSWENQFLRPNRNFHEIGAHGLIRRTSRPRAQIMRKSIFTAESQFSWNWVLTAQINAEAVPELRSWENQFLRPNRNFHEIGRSRPKSTQKPSPSSDHEKINFYGRIAIFMKLGAHGPKQRRSRPRAQIMRKSIFTAESQFSWNWRSRPNSAHKPSPSSDHEKINFYVRIAIFMKLGAHSPNQRRSRPRAQIMRKSIFTAESQFSWNWVLTAQINAEAVPKLRSWENQFLRPSRNFHEIGWSRPKSMQNVTPELTSWENQFLRPNRNFHEIGCSRPKSAHNLFPS